MSRIPKFRDRFTEEILFYMDEGQEAAISEFFEDFVAAFLDFDGARVANKFTIPYLAFVTVDHVEE